MAFKYELDYNNQTTEIEAPENFKDVRLKLRRGKSSYSVSQIFSFDKAIFTGIGKEIIENAFKQEDIQANVILHISILKRGYNWERFFSVKVSLARKDSTHTTVSCTLQRTGFNVKFEAGRKNKIKIENPVTVNMHSKVIRKKVRLEAQDGGEIKLQNTLNASSNHNDDTLALIDGEFQRTQQSGPYSNTHYGIIHLTGNEIVNNFDTLNIPNSAPVLEKLIYNKYQNLYDISCRIKGTFKAFHLGYQLVMKDYDSSNNVFQTRETSRSGNDQNIDFDVFLYKFSENETFNPQEILIQSERIHSGSFGPPLGPKNFFPAYAWDTRTNGTGAGTLGTERWHYHENNFPFDFTVTFNNIVEDNKNIALILRTTFTSNPNRNWVQFGEVFRDYGGNEFFTPLNEDPLLNTGTSSEKTKIGPNSFPSNTISFDSDYFIEITSNTVEPVTTCRGVSWFEAFKQVVEGITGVQNSFVSDYFDIGGPGEKEFITNGLQIRQFPYINNEIHASFNDLFEGYIKTPLGYQVKKENGVDIVRVEPVEYFFSSDEALRLIIRSQDINDEVDEKLYYNKITIGFDDFLTSTLLGRDEMLSLMEFTTGIDQAENEYMRVSKIVHSGYVIEQTRRIRYEDDNDLDDKRDETLFSIILNNDKTAAERNENFADVQNIISPQTSYNLRYQIKRMFLNHFKLFGAGLMRIPESIISFAYGEGNNSAQTNIVDTNEIPGDVLDSQDISRDNLSPLFVPYRVMFETGIDYEQYLSMLENANGIFKVSTDDGISYVDYYLWDADVKIGNESFIVDFVLMKKYV